MITKDYDRTVAVIKNRIAALRQTIKPIEEKISHLNKTIEILESDNSNFVQEPLNLVTYPAGNDFNLKLLWAIRHIGRFSNKNEILSVIKGRETPEYYNLIIQHSMHVLQALVRNKKVVLARYNSSNLFCFYGQQEWLALSNMGDYFILPNYEVNKVHLAKVIKETAEYRGL